MCEGGGEVHMWGDGGEVHVWGVEERCMCGGGGEVHVWGRRRGACVKE